MAVKLIDLLILFRKGGKNIRYLCIDKINKKDRMTKIQEFLAALPEDKKALFVPVFGNVDKFYTVVYLVTRNEHITDQENRSVMKTACR